MSNTKLEQIKEKYKPPEYRPYRNAEILTILALIIWGILFLAYYFLFFPPPPPQQSLIEPDEYVFERAIHQWVTIAMFIPGGYLLYKARKLSKERGISNQILFNKNEIPQGKYVTILGFSWLVFSFVAKWGLNLQNEQFWFHFLISIYFIFVPFLVSWSIGSDLLERQEIRQELESSDNRKNNWEAALKYEQNNQFDDAAKIWADLGEENEVRRVTEMKAESGPIILEQKIQELKSKGIDTEELEEQLTTLERTMDN